MGLSAKKRAQALDMAREMFIRAEPEREITRALRRVYGWWPEITDIVADAVASVHDDPELP